MRWRGGHRSTIGDGPDSASVNIGLTAQSTVGSATGVGDGAGGAGAGPTGAGVAAHEHPTSPRLLFRNADAIGSMAG